jgi:hypothetical protein
VSAADPQRLAATADQLRHEAALVDLISGVLAEGVSLLDAAGSLAAVAHAKRAAAVHLDEMAQEAKS